VVQGFKVVRAHNLIEPIEEESAYLNEGGSMEPIIRSSSAMRLRKPCCCCCCCCCVGMVGCCFSMPTLLDPCWSLEGMICGFTYYSLIIPLQRIYLSRTSCCFALVVTSPRMWGEARAEERAMGRRAPRRANSIVALPQLILSISN